MTIQCFESNEYKKKQCRLDSRFRGNDSERVDTPEGPAYDSENNMSSSCLTRGTINNEFNLTGFSGRTPDGVCRRMTGGRMSSSDLIGGSTRQQCRMDSRFRGNDRGECGRSMVEMLGTLAIIGVLSIGGIAGYSYGMDKYRANETLKDINLRVVDLLTQASQGREALSLAEWENEDSIYDFSDPAYVEGENLIAFDVGTTKKMPKSVCQMVFDGLANTAVQIDINAVHSNSNEDCGTDNTMTFYFEGGGNGTGGETTGEQCGSTVCGTCQKCENESCVTVADYEIACTTGGKTGWCVSGVCEAETTCNCGEGEYCTDKNTSGGSCYNPTPSGTCKDAASQFRTVNIDGATYYISNSTMSWWNAVSACEALGNKRLLTVEDIVIRNDDDTTGYLSNSHVKTSVGEALYSEMGSEYIWSSILHNSCTAYGVDLYDGGVGNDGRNDDSSYAVCR